MAEMGWSWPEYLDCPVSVAQRILDQMQKRPARVARRR